MPVAPVPPLRAVRLLQGLGLRETARRAGMDHAQLSRIERGQEGLSLDALSRLAKVLGLRDSGGRDLSLLLETYRPTPEMREPAWTGSKGSRGNQHAKPN
jgi:transcriptional regulator with XRE-family HTH domain